MKKLDGHRREEVLQIIKFTLFSFQRDSFKF